jgi:hypothetical protein
MPRKHTVPRRKRQAKQRNLTTWRKENPPAKKPERCAMVHPGGIRCPRAAARLGYCLTCWEGTAR